MKINKYYFVLFFVSLITYSQTFEEVSEIVYNKCTSCHRPGESGPINFTNYEEVAGFANMIEEVTSSDYMPPWPPDPNYSNLLDERFLTDDEKQLISDWVQNGAPQGNPLEEAPMPTFTEGSSIGEPDIVYEMEEAYLIEGNNYDDYRVFVFPTNFEEDMYISSIEFRPDNREMVHHAIIMADVSGEGAVLDSQDDTYGYESYGGFGLSVPPTQYVFLGGYAPGMNPIVWSGNLGMKIPAGSDILCQIHYAPSSIDEWDQSSINVFLKNAEDVEREVQMKMWVEFDWAIPAGDPNYVVERCLDFDNGIFQEDCSLPEDWSVLGFLPHSHLLGKSWEVFAETPNGEVVPFIKIPNWDFNWQGFYYSDYMLHVPAGSQIKGVATYDNSEDNPLNPNNPPQTMNWGELTTDEMFFCPIYYLPYEEGDENIYLGSNESSSNIKESVIENIELYPSPASEYIDLSFTLNNLSVTEVLIKIYDVAGRVVHKEIINQLKNNNNNHRIDLISLKNGQYILEMTSNEQKMIQKFTKQ